MLYLGMFWKLVSSYHFITDSFPLNTCHLLKHFNGSKLIKIILQYIFYMYVKNVQCILKIFENTNDINWYHPEFLMFQENIVKWSKLSICEDVSSRKLKNWKWFCQPLFPPVMGLMSSELVQHISGFFNFLEKIHLLAIFFAFGDYHIF